jgi:hypothetical protein
MPAKLTVQIANKLAESKGGKFLSSEWLGARGKYKWECHLGHSWDAFYGNIKRGHWCPFCSGNSPKTDSDYFELANKNNGKCTFIGKNTADLKTTWKCFAGHIWANSYGNIASGQWCPLCAGNFKKTDDDFFKLADQKDGKCLLVGKNANDASSEWQCSVGHVWNTSYKSIQQGTWCPFCAGNILKSKSDYDALAEKNKGLCLFAANNVLSNKSQWKCEFGHIWNACFVNIRSGTWCPKCSSSKNQKRISNALKFLFPKTIIENNYNKFGWLKTKRGVQHLDIYIPELKLVVEYDGEQHFKPIQFGGISIEHAIKNLKITKKMDKIKNNKIKNHPEDVKFFIRINYKEKNKIEDCLVSKLSAIGFKFNGGLEIDEC